ncbi:hypothetical protein NGRA_3568 [Nosema granulosis]|uniref:FLYWCH-type domain-containing protein n=1 Tax=Nosema granulosis TaxID=83296 RepID=A0A9P6KX18_9MICR|nr:hypothetical protein NGRA_3568 [Nosema granulosis]
MKINLEKNIIESNRGGQKIAYKGYFYNFKEDLNDCVIWRCNSRGCNAVLETNFTYDLVDIGVHSHLKDEIKYNRVLLIQKAKKRALVSSESTRNIVLNVLKNNKELHVPLDLKRFNSMVSKERKSNNFTEVKGYDIPMELQVTENNKRFLFYDSGMEDKNRVVIFTTEKNLSLLEFSDVLLCDGTCWEMGHQLPSSVVFVHIKSIY